MESTHLDLPVRDGLTIPADFLSVSYTRDLGDGGGAEAARQTPTNVELRLDVKRCEALDARQKGLILGHPELRADRRGTVRVGCDEFRSRTKNLEGARARLAFLLREALDERRPQDDDGADDRRRRRGAGLFKGIR